ncbi:Putative fluoride ion transporter CrcB [Vibrio stylophorae]|uniref:Fluoride-specific ion channel FluC n=1 Tax=Vibrio stylophorae TaxID=659351 RepID=A0ABM8ZPK2_9VIBR|nr:fluoride efflux transporter CrcB [Vibrio stylophorae]CAH0532249.1 Putative fluoride ion transporter CrcB [Vibrio stylophorae]
MNSAITLAFVASGGAIGACFRFLISEWCVLVFGRGFPYGTLTVNVLGSLIMGFLMAAIELGLVAAAPWRHLVGLGLLGALTTFSSFSMENVTLLNQGEFVKMGLHIVLNVTLCIFATWASYTLMRTIHG